MRAKTGTSLWAFVGMLAVIGVAMLLDGWTKNMRGFGSTTGQPNILLWGFALANIITAVCLVALIWYVLAQSRLNRMMSLIFLVVGMLITLYPPVMLSNNFISRLFSSLPMFSPASHLGFTGAVIAALGAFCLVVNREESVA